MARNAFDAYDSHIRAAAARGGRVFFQALKMLANLSETEQSLKDTGARLDALRDSL